MDSTSGRRIAHDGPESARASALTTTASRRYFGDRPFHHGVSCRSDGHGNNSFRRPPRTIQACLHPSVHSVCFLACCPGPLRRRKSVAQVQGRVGFSDFVDMLFSWDNLALSGNISRASFTPRSRFSARGPGWPACALEGQGNGGRRSPREGRIFPRPVRGERVAEGRVRGAFSLSQPAGPPAGRGWPLDVARDGPRAG